MANQALADMIGVVKSGGERILGGEPPKGVAREWLDAGLSPEVAETYIEVGSWDAELVGQLFRAGIKASDLADDDVVTEVIKERGLGVPLEGWSGLLDRGHVRLAGVPAQ